MQNIFLKISGFLLIVFLFTACFGDRQSIIGQDLSDTSFVNKNFKGNKIDYKKGMSACEQLSAATIAELYSTTNDKVILTDPSKSDRYAPTPDPACHFHILLSEVKGDHLTGSISIFREVAKKEQMGDIAEAAGIGKNWEEAWALKKAMYKSAEWLPNMGKAALWRAKKRTLNIKLEGYTLSIVAPGATFNKKEQAKKRDYKKIAISIAKQSGFL